MQQKENTEILNSTEQGKNRLLGRQSVESGSGEPTPQYQKATKFGRALVINEAYVPVDFAV